MKIFKIVTLVVILSVFLLGCIGNEDIPPAEAKPKEVTVPVLMFHDVKTVEGGTWSMSADNFRAVLVFLLESGYTPVSFDRLVEFVDGSSDIPEKPVVITLDDGYFSNYRNVLPIVTELEVPVTVFMTASTVRPEGRVPGADESILEKMSAAELKIMESSPLVTLQSHTHALHGTNTSYSDTPRDNSLPLKDESEQDYKRVFEEDLALSEAVLREAGTESFIVFSYPSGKSSRWAEEVLKERGYRVSLTTDYGHRNAVTQGRPDTLFKLGRMNVNDDTTEDMLLKYLERE